MLGPLPTIYRIVVIACALVVCVGVGAWLAATLPGPRLAGRGAMLGAGFGALLAMLLVHDFRHQHAGAPVRVRTRHRD